MESHPNSTLVPEEENYVQIAHDRGRWRYYSHLDQNGVAARVAFHGIGVAGASLADHPLPAMIDAGIVVTLGSDDPPLVGSSLLAEYAAAWECSALDEAGLAELAANSLRCSFASPERIETWLA